MKRFRFLLIAAILHVTLLNGVLAQPGAPCNAVRWSKGGHWEANCAVNDANNAPDPLGVIRCGNAAGTESGIDNNTTYDHNVFEVIPNNCIDPDDLSPVNITAPFDGQKIAWFNFDVRPGAPTFDFQCIATGNYELEWILYYSAAPTCGVGGDGLSGACGGTLTKIACGTDFNGWSPQPYQTPNINLPTNLYLVIWRKGATPTDNPDFDFTFKARYGCGASVPCLAVDCPSSDGGTYECASEIPAGATNEAEFEAIDEFSDIMTNCPGTLSITHQDVESGSCELGTLIVTRTYTITFTPSNGDPASVEMCAQVFTLDDNTAPVLSGCPPADGGSYQCLTDVPAPAVVTASDNCGTTPTVDYSQTMSNPGSSCNNTITRTWSADDCAGNSSSCSQTILVNDDMAPTFSCPADVTIECDEDASDLNLTGMVTDEDDNCGLGGNVPTYSDDASGLTGCNGTGVLLRTWSLMDACGNEAISCTQSITIEDTTPPMAYDPADVTTLSCVGELPCPTANDPVIAGLIAQIQSNSTDNCGSVTAVFQNATDITTCSDPDGDGIYTFGRTYTFSVSDACGNHSEVSVSYSGVCQPICTYTQGAWGNSSGAPGTTVGMTDNNLINMLIAANGGKIRIGTTTNNRYLDITSASCVFALLPGGGSAGPLASLTGCNKTGCARCNPTGSGGKLKNNLANNTIALQLNIWFSQQNWDNNPNTNWNLGNESLSCIASIPADVLAKLAQLGLPNTVDGLLKLSNMYLGGEVSGVSSGNLTNAVTTINERWDECQQPSNASACASMMLMVGNLGNPTFHAWKQEQKVNLRWFIRHSEDVDHFEVERSLDGEVYSKIASLLPSESVDLENYVAVDNYPEKGINRYQLVIYLKNGEVETMPEVEIEFAKTKPYSLLPNPAKTEAWLDLTAMTNRKDVTISVTNCFGQEILRLQIDEVKDDYPRLDLHDLRDGLYFVTVKVGREIYSDKLIIANMDR